MINKIEQKLTTNLTKKVAIVGAGAGAGAALSALVPQLTKSNVDSLDYLEKSAASISSKMILHNEDYTPNPGESQEKYFERLRKNQEEKLNSEIRERYSPREPSYNHCHPRWG